MHHFNRDSRTVGRDQRSRQQDVEASAYETLRPVATTWAGELGQIEKLSDATVDNPGCPIPWNRRSAH